MKCFLFICRIVKFSGTDVRFCQVINFIGFPITLSVKAFNRPLLAYFMGVNPQNSEIGDRKIVPRAPTFVHNHNIKRRLATRN